MRSAWWLRLVLLAYAVGVLAYRDAIMDDTFVHLQYARNLRASGELAFNAGEPSMGVTSPLWMLLLAAAGAGETAARLLSVACGAFAALVFVPLARRLLGRQAWVVAASVAWAGSLWLVRHAPNGMETTLAALLVLAAVSLRTQSALPSWRRDVAVGLVLAGACLARPEGVVLVLVLAVQDLASRAGRERLAVWLPACVLPCAAWIAFAHGQTGRILPDTGTAKSAGLAFAPEVWLRVLWRQARILGGAHAVEMLGAALGLASALRPGAGASRRRLRRHPLLPYVVFACLVVGAYAATDLQVQPRYLVPMLPVLVLAGFAAWQAILGGGARAAAAACVASLAVGAVFGARTVYPATRDFARGVRGVIVPMARDIASRNVPGAVVATPDIGIVGFVSGARVLDLGGLVEPRIQDLVRQHGYDAMLERGLFLDFGRVDYVVDRSPERERFAGHMTRGLTWRALRTAPVRGLGISRPQVHYYTLYALEPARAYGAAPAPARAGAAP